MLNKIRVIADKVITTNHFDLMTVGEKYYVSPHSNREKLLGPFQNVQINGRYVIDIETWKGQTYQIIKQVFNGVGQRLDIESGKWVDEAPRLMHSTGKILRALYKAIGESESDMLEMVYNRDVIGTSGEIDLIYLIHAEVDVRGQKCISMAFDTGLLEEPVDYMGIANHKDDVAGVWSLSEHLWKIPIGRHKIFVNKTATGQSIAFAQSRASEYIAIARKSGSNPDVLSLNNQVDNYNTGFEVETKETEWGTTYKIRKNGQIIFNEVDRIAILEGVYDTIFVMEHKNAAALCNGNIQSDESIIEIGKAKAITEYQSKRYVMHYILSGILYGVQVD